MKQKKNNKTLLILLIIVVILIGALEIYERFGSTQLKDNLTDVNFSKITRIALSNTKVDQYISLRKETIGWFLTAEKVQIPIENYRIDKIQPLFTKMTPIKAVSNNQNDWEKYETTDEQGLRITAYNVKDILSDFFIGKTESDTVSGKTISYVRIQGDMTTYAVEEDLTKIFAQDFFEQIFPNTNIDSLQLIKSCLQ